VHLDVPFQHMGEDQQVEQRGQHRRRNRLRGDLPEAQHFLVEQGGKAAVAHVSSPRLGLALHDADEDFFQVRLADLEIVDPQPAARMRASSGSTSSKSSKGKDHQPPLSAAPRVRSAGIAPRLRKRRVWDEKRSSSLAVVSSATTRPALQHGDPAAQVLGFLEVMRGQHDGVAGFVQAPDEGPQGLAQFDVDAGRRLVEHDHRRPVHQRLGHQHAALHAARQHAHVGVGLGRQPEVLEDLVYPRVVVANAEVAGLDSERFAHREEGVEHQFLRHHPEVTARGTIVGLDIVAHHAKAAGIGAHQPGQG
jgi:hypothetical protein